MDEQRTESQDQSLDNAVSLFRDSARRKADQPALPPLYVRKASLVIGIMLGFAYGLATQFCNSLVAPSIPYTHYPFGIVGNIAASVIGFTLICWVASLPKDYPRGALFGALSAVAILHVRALVLGVPMFGEYGSRSFFYGLLGIFVELVMAFPAMLIFRWMIAIQADHFDKSLWSWPRVALPVVFLAGALGLGLFSLYPQDVTAAMLDTNALMRRGLQASTVTDLPPSLQNENDVRDFLYYSEPSFTLELGDYQVTPEDPIAGTEARYTITIIARFKSGWTISCLYENRLQDPACQSYDSPNAPPITDFRAAISP